MLCIKYDIPYEEKSIKKGGIYVIALNRIDVSPQKEAQFAAKGITCVEELSLFFPRKYYDFRERTEIKDLRDGEIVRVTGVLRSVNAYDRVTAVLTDGTGDMELTWFGRCYYYSRMAVGTEWTFCGKVSEYYGRMQMVQPMLHAEGHDAYTCIYPVYSKISGMSDKYLQEKIEASLSTIAVNNTLPEQEALAKSMGLPTKIAALRETHRPTGREQWRNARSRVVFDQIYQFYEELYTRKRNRSFAAGKPMMSREKTEEFIWSLPYPLTADQRKAIDAVADGAKGGAGLNALITGDVGCGKTVVALASAVLAWENGYQTVIMAPTLVLAKQHYEEMTKLTEGLDINFALLTSEAKARERKKILAGIKDGSINILIGTHSVLSSDLEFQNLGMTIVDEEHRFGTRQKQLLELFDKVGAHHLSMTATPIPRSYAAAVYGGNTTVIPIETMPAGRKPVITTVENNREEVYRKLLAEVQIGHQAYVVCPFIEDSDDEKFQSVLSVAAVTQELKKFCTANAPAVKVTSISGDMKQKEILEVIGQFARNEVQILISTTIVEVGVNVPNATAIAIINAERFGMSALHQLRGRVGRKGDQGYCFLVSKEKNEKLDALVKYSSGFKIAEMDLSLRGPGDILGESQTGDSKVIELILRWPKMSEKIRRYFAGKEDAI